MPALIGVPEVANGDSDAIDFKNLPEPKGLSRAQARPTLLLPLTLLIYFF
jgi:hypothetical protein